MKLFIILITITVLNLSISDTSPVVINFESYIRSKCPTLSDNANFFKQSAFEECANVDMNNITQSNYLKNNTLLKENSNEVLCALLLNTLLNFCKELQTTGISLEPEKLIPQWTNEYASGVDVVETTCTYLINSNSIFHKNKVLCMKYCTDEKGLLLPKCFLAEYYDMKLPPVILTNKTASVKNSLTGSIDRHTDQGIDRLDKTKLETSEVTLQNNQNGNIKPTETKANNSISTKQTVAQNQSTKPISSTTIVGGTSSIRGNTQVNSLPSAHVPPNPNSQQISDTNAQQNEVEGNNPQSSKNNDPPPPPPEKPVNQPQETKNAPPPPEEPANQPASDTKNAPASHEGPDNKPQPNPEVAPEHVENIPQLNPQEVVENPQVNTDGNKKVNSVETDTRPEAPPEQVNQENIDTHDGVFDEKPDENEPEDDVDDDARHDVEEDAVEEQGKEPIGTIKEETKLEKPEKIEEDVAVSSSNIDDIDGESYFFSYFMVVCVLFVLGYIFYHNRTKVMALVLEGKRSKRQYRGRRPNSANYHKLDSNLEEAISSSCSKNSSNIIY